MDRLVSATSPSLTLPTAVLPEDVDDTMVTATELAEMYGFTAATIVHRLGRAGAPSPVGRLVVKTGARYPALWDCEEAVRYLDSSSAQMRNRSPLRPGGPGLGRSSRYGFIEPALVGTRTPTAGKPYVWRDPLRWRPSA